MVSDRQAALQILGLSEGASDEEIRLAYKKLSMKWHPDKNQNSSEATHMMQQLNAAKGRLEEEEETYEWEEDDDDEYYDDDDDYYDEDDDDDYSPPFGNGRMDFAAFLRMFAELRAAGVVDDDGRFVGPSPSKSKRGSSFCFCPECRRRRRSDPRERELRREEARKQKMQEELEAARLRAEAEADKQVQLTDPKKSLAWHRGGESRERLIREHFLRQTPSLILHAAQDDELLLLLDVPDVSLLENGRMPPKGVEWEVSFCIAGSSKWTQVMAPKEYDNVIVPKLIPGTEYLIKVRTGLTGSLTWSGSPDWGQWSKPQQFKTTGQQPAAAGGGGKGSKAATAAGRGKKKKKNRDAAFAKLTQDDSQQQQQQQGDGQESEEQQQQHSEGEVEQQHQEQQDVQQLSEQAVEQQEQQQQISETLDEQQQQEQLHQENAQSVLVVAAAVEDSREQQQQEEDSVQQSGQLVSPAHEIYVQGQQQQQLVSTVADSKLEFVAETMPRQQADHALGNAGSSSSSAAAAVVASRVAVEQHTAATVEGNTAAAAAAQIDGALHSSDAGSSSVSTAADAVDSCLDDDPLAAAEAAAAAVEAAEAAGLPIPKSKPQKQKHNPVSMAACIYYPFGKCKEGNACRFRHEKPTVYAATLAAAAAAAGGENALGVSTAQLDVAKLDALMAAAGSSHPWSLKKCQEITDLAQKIVTAKSTPRYQPEPQDDGSYIKPLFVTAYDVTSNCYASWYNNMQQGVIDKTIPVKPDAATIRSRLLQPVVKDTPSPNRPSPPPPAVPCMSAPAAAGISGSSSSSSVGQPAAAAAGSRSETAVHRSSWRTQPCRWFQMGTCKFGDKCKFLHVQGSGPLPAAESTHAQHSSGDSDAGGTQRKIMYAPQQQQQQQQQPYVQYGMQPPPPHQQQYLPKPYYQHHQQQQYGKVMVNAPAVIPPSYGHPHPQVQQQQQQQQHYMYGWPYIQ